MPTYRAEFSVTRVTWYTSRVAADSAEEAQEKAQEMLDAMLTGEEGHWDESDYETVEVSGLRIEES